MHDLEIDFGDSEVYNDGSFMQYWYRQLFHITKYVLQNSVNMFGTQIINPNLPKYAAQYFGDQFYYFPLQIQQIEKFGDLNLNWRLTEDPEIHDSMIDFSFLFDVGAVDDHCTIPFDQHNYDFEDHDERYVQIILSDRVPNCLLESLGK
jgi:hypothetical protein